MNISGFYKNENEKPLDRLVSDGGLCSILRTVVCIGDSLSSGEFEVFVDKEERYWQDMFEYSWGQFMARMAGIKVYNFSRGGMTAKEYCETFADEKGLWNVDIKANAYIIALAVNDLFKPLPLGEISDVNPDDSEKNGESFIGYYAKIVQRYKKISPDAKFFFVTPPVYSTIADVGDKVDKVIELLYGLKDLFKNCYVIDLNKYGPDYTTQEFRDNFFLNGHLSPSGYYLTAKMTCSYIDYIIRNNPMDFKLLGFQNTPVYNEKLEQNNLK